MIKKSVLSFCLLLISIVVLSQSNNLVSRKAFTLKLALEDSNIYKKVIKASPYILANNTILLYPSEKIFIEVELDKKGIKSMKTVKANLHPERTFTITFSQQVDGKMHVGMMLKVENPFNRKLNYKASVLLQQSKKWIPVNVLPIGINLSAFETWSVPIIAVSLSAWELI